MKSSDYILGKEIIDNYDSLKLNRFETLKYVSPEKRQIITANTNKIIAIGNPGSGKSTFLNSLAGECLFKSGFNPGSGLTYQLDVRRNFYDTPGLADPKKRKKAGEAISEALRTGGKFNIFFFVKQDEGRVINEDITTLKLVLESAPEIGNKYGIIVSKVPKETLIKIKEPTAQAKIIETISRNLPKERLCPADSFLFVENNEDLEGESNKIIQLEKFVVVNAKKLSFIEFVYSGIESVHLNKSNIHDIKTEDFEEMTNMVANANMKIEALKSMAGILSVPCHQIFYLR